MDWAYSPDTCDLVPLAFLKKGADKQKAPRIWLGEDGLYVGVWRPGGARDFVVLRDKISGPYETVTDAKFAAELLFG